jgi:hypothetical protein
MRLSFTTAAGPRQRTHSQVRVPRDSWPHFTVSSSRLFQPVGPSPPIYIPQEKRGLVIAPGTGFPYSSPYTTRRATVEVLDPASVSVPGIQHWGEPHRKHRLQQLYCCVFSKIPPLLRQASLPRKRLQRSYIRVDGPLFHYSGFQPSCHELQLFHFDVYKEFRSFWLVDCF